MLTDVLHTNRVGDYAGDKQRAVNLDQAERAYRQALVADSTSDEARLRLGRVLSLKGNDVDARTNLESLLNQTHDARIVYLVHLFLAQIDARRHDDEDAAGEYIGRDCCSPVISSALRRSQQPRVARRR